MKLITTADVIKFTLHNINPTGRITRGISKLIVIYQPLLRLDKIFTVAFPCLKHRREFLTHHILSKQWRNSILSIMIFYAGTWTTKPNPNNKISISYISCNARTTMDVTTG